MKVTEFIKKEIKGIKGKHIILATAGALLVTAFAILRLPLDLAKLSIPKWILLLFSPLVSVFLFYLLMKKPERSIFRFIKYVYSLGAPFIPALLLPLFFDPNKKVYYIDNFLGRFLPVWGAVWWLGLIILYVIIKLCENYVKERTEEEASSSVLCDLAVMYTPQKKISSRKRKGKGKWILAAICILAVSIGVFLFVVALFLYNVYTNMEFEAILFTVTFAKGGLAAEDIIAGAEYTLLFALISGYIAYNMLKCFRNDELVVTDNNKDGKYTLVMNGKKRALHIVLSFVILFGCMTFFTLQTNFLHYVDMKRGKSTIYEDYYVTPDESVITFPDKKRNLIFIYIESMENSYASIQDGGSQEKNYMSELTDLTRDKDSVNISNNELMGGASVFVPAITYTQGSTVAQTSGISLNTKILPPNGTIEYPVMRRLEDILHDNGYNQLYIQGSKGEFSMYDEYVGRYDDSRLYDRVKLTEEGYSDESQDYIWKWGIEDRKLFEITKELITKVSIEDKPFFVTMYTMDTHSSESGHRCPLCDENIVNDYLAAVDCTSKQTEEFVKWVKQQPFYEDTTIILVGDHPGNKKTTMVEIDDDYVRTTYNCFINAAKAPVNPNNRSFSSLDMFPTTLSAIGAEIKGDRLGLGTDLFSDKKTLCEELGAEEYRRQLELSSDYYDNVFTPEK